MREGGKSVALSLTESGIKKVSKAAPAWPGQAPVDLIRVGLGEGATARAPAVLTSVGIGSCVVLTLYDGPNKIGGLAHVVLPEDPRTANGLRPFACADTALDSLIADLLLLGGARRHLVAKLAGGARMFPTLVEEHESIGKLNAVKLKALLETAGIPLVGRDLGGHHGRNVEFHLDTGQMRVWAPDRLPREF